MTHVATIIAPPGALDDAALARARAALPGTAPAQWLAPGAAADIPFNAEPGADQRSITVRLHEAVAAPLDIVVQPQAGRRKRLFLADMDSTMIRQECIDELADFVGLKAHVAAITERAMRGEIAFEPALRERVALLKGLHAGVVEEVIAGRIALTPGGRTLIATLHAHGAHTCLVSGGFTLFTGRIAAMLGFREHRANVMVVEPDGRFAGLVEEPILGSEAKLAALRELTARFALAPGDTMATGDGANDLAMIAAAGLGVAFHAKPKVAEAAAARIDHGDLTALLYIQGYRQDEFAAA